MSAAELVKAVILARGLGTRIRRLDASAQHLNTLQARMADRGLKAMIPVGRPFLDYVLSGLADAGYREACLVIGPEHEVVREYYTRTCVPKRLQVSFAIQERPLGTADAVAAAETFAGSEHFLVLNSDNYYPTAACRALRLLGQPALVSFESQSLAREGNVSAERVRQFAVVTTHPDGTLERIIEKPDEATLRALGPEIYVSMNCWSFSPAIFCACAAITPSPRGELELTDAVQYAINRLGERFRVLTFHAGVLDLSSRADIAAVAERLRGIEVHL
jgi:glucose-1-phosphate thymidylyltransferase